MSNLRAALAYFAIGVAAFAIIAGGRQLGWLVGAELALADAMTAARATPAQGDDSDILVVLIEESDVRDRGWPLSDGVLAEALAKVLAQNPVAVGVDIYRDNPVGEGAEALDALLRRDGRVIWVTKFGAGAEDGVAAPAALDGTGRTGFADMVVDADGVVRRALLFLDDGDRYETSLALMLAAPYLAARGAPLAGSEEDPDALAIGGITLQPFAGDEGPYRGADDAGYQIPLDFARGAAPARLATLTDVMEGRLAADAATGKIVLIGAGAQTVKDSFLTPVSQTGGDTFGVVLHASIVDQYLRHGLQGAPRQAGSPRFAEHAWLLVCALLGAAIGALARAPLLFAAALTAFFAAQAGAAWAAFAAFIWTPAAPGALAAALSAVSGGALTAWRQTWERRSLMSLFSRHVSGEVAARIWRDRDAFLTGDGAPRPQRLTATVLFSDIRGFTPVSERLDEEELMAWLNAYMTEMASAVIENGGVIDKYIGDAVMAVWGAPAPRESEAEIDADARAAAACALDMAARLDGLNARSAAEGLPPVSMRIGLHTGPLVAGSLGSRERLEYTVIGDTVNVAARLESAANRIYEAVEAKGESQRVAIAISEATRRRLGAGFAVVSLGKLALKGKAEGLEAHELTGALSVDDPGEQLEESE